MLLVLMSLRSNPQSFYVEVQIQPERRQKCREGHDLLTHISAQCFSIKLGLTGGARLASSTPWVAGEQ